MSRDDFIAEAKERNCCGLAIVKRDGKVFSLLNSRMQNGKPAYTTKTWGFFLSKVNGMEVIEVIDLDAM